MLLLVEDNPMFSAGLARMLDRLGETYEIVDTGEEAVRRVFEHGERYSLMLLDIGLPGISGVDVARVVRSIADAAKADLPILVMSVAMPALTADELARLRFSGLLPKAFLIEDLRAAIHAHERVPSE